MVTDLAQLNQLAKEWKTSVQQHIEAILGNEFDMDTQDMLWDLVEIARTATRPTPTGEIIEDYKVRLAATKLLLELTGNYTPSKANVNVSFGYMNKIYQKKPQNEWQVIEATTK